MATCSKQQATGISRHEAAVTPDEAASDCELLPVTGLLPVPGELVVPAVPTAVEFLAPLRGRVRSPLLLLQLLACRSPSCFERGTQQRVRSGRDSMSEASRCRQCEDEVSGGSS